MIDWLEIRQLAIAEHLQLEFGPAFTAITGETGSGKSLIVDAVGVLLGDRAENTLIRAQAEQAEIEGGFRLNAGHPALAHLRENGLDSGDECILRRVVRRDKPSRAYINGRSVNASMMRDLGRELVDIHGQHEHHSLLSRAGQLQLLDAGRRQHRTPRATRRAIRRAQRNSRAPAASARGRRKRARPRRIAGGVYRRIGGAVAERRGVAKT